MNIAVKYAGLKAGPVWQAMVEAQLKALEDLTAIATARVTLERRPEATPAFRVSALLQVPGPDFHAEAVDHTLNAALQKTVENLKHQILARLTRRQVKAKSGLQLSTISRRWSGGMTGHRP